MTPVIFGLKGAALSDAERGFFREAEPAGYILFARNVVDPAQMRRLCDDLKNLAGDGRLPILIDQEGGRVARLRPPHWLKHPPGAAYAALYEKDPEAAREALKLSCHLLAAELSSLGITVDCLPVLDVRQPGASDVIGDRAYGDSPDQVADLGAAAVAALLERGIVPVIKHIPGHGRAKVDSHKALPVVGASIEELRATDFPPFHRAAQAPMAMTAHIVYSAIDPDNCATFSAKLIGEVIRGELGFQGLLLSDDLSMGALEGDYAARTRRVLAAGCDIVLHCNGAPEEMQAVASALPSIPDAARARLKRAMAMPNLNPMRDPVSEMAARRDALLNFA